MGVLSRNLFNIGNWREEFHKTLARVRKDIREALLNFRKCRKELPISVPGEEGPQSPVKSPT